MLLQVKSERLKGATYDLENLQCLSLSVRVRTDIWYEGDGVSGGNLILALGGDDGALAVTLYTVAAAPCINPFWAEISFITLYPRIHVLPQLRSSKIVNIFTDYLLQLWQSLKIKQFVFTSFWASRENLLRMFGSAEWILYTPA